MLCSALKYIPNPFLFLILSQGLAKSSQAQIYDLPTSASESAMFTIIPSRQAFLINTSFPDDRVRKVEEVVNDCPNILVMWLWISRNIWFWLP